MGLGPELVFLRRKGPALDIIAIPAEGDVYLALQVQDAQEPHGGRLLTGTKLQARPLVEGQSVEPGGHLRAFLTDKVPVRLPESVNLALGPEEIWNTTGHA